MGADYGTYQKETAPANQKLRNGRLIRYDLAESWGSLTPLRQTSRSQSSNQVHPKPDTTII